MQQERKNVGEAVGDLIENLGTIGQFMLSELWSLRRLGLSSSREDFVEALNKVARSMKESGKWAADDVERAANEIKNNWRLLSEENRQEWEQFVGELEKRLKTLGEITQDTFNLSVDQAKKTLERQWTATGRVGEEQLKACRERSEKMATAFRDQWSTFLDQMERTGRKVDRAIQAAWEELRKKE
ncbi:MAG: hypothetical protein FJ118_10460 [Deltaproteobacteria bacterium]|nr:hypothetical protein [Deltaproteobacteria bacterium]